LGQAVFSAASCFQVTPCIFLSSVHGDDVDLFDPAMCVVAQLHLL
jgi:hypothetical protein